jgi:hypothetical protein
LATIKNVIKTEVQVTGDKQANTAIGRLDRSQTRLAQTSASAGRAFAAQSQGLGGLVAAYAGAAATTFALQQAFDKLSASARTLQTLEGLTTLAAEAGQSAESLLSSVREITKNQLTIAETAAQINLTLSAGFNTEQIEGLAEVSLKASRALGRDLTDAMTRVVRGSAKMETELLDELGIYTKIDPAVRAYAAAIGKSVSELSEFERRQAFANSVIEEGLRKFSAINTTVPNAAEQIEAFGVKILDLTTQVGQVIAVALAPLASFLTNNVAAAFATLGIAATLVGRKAVDVLRGGIASLEQKLKNAAIASEIWSTKILKIRDTSVIAASTIAELDTSTLKLEKSTIKNIQALQKESEKRQLSRTEMIFVRQELEKNILALEAETLAIKEKIEAERLQQKAILDTRAANQIRVAEAQKELDALRAAPVTDFTSPLGKANAVRKAKREVDSLNAALVETDPLYASLNEKVLEAEKATRGLNEQIQKNQQAIQSLNPAIDTFRSKLAAAVGAVSNAKAKLVNFFGNIGASVLNASSTIFFWVSALTLAGSSIANILGKGREFEAFVEGVGSVISNFFNDIESRQLGTTLLGVTAGALTDLEKINTELANLESFEFKTKTFLGIEFNVSKTKEDLVNDVASAVQEAAERGTDTFGESLTSGLSLALGGIFAIIGTAILGPVGTYAGAAIGAALGAAIVSSTEDSLDVATQQYVDRYIQANARFLEGLSENEKRTAALATRSIEESYGAALRTDPQVRAAFEVQQQLIRESAQYVDNIEAVSNLMNALGIDAAEVARNFNLIDPDATASGIEKAVSEAITNIGEEKLTLRFFDVNIEEIQDALSNVTFQIPLQLSSDLLGAKNEEVVADITATAENALGELRRKIADGTVELADAIGTLMPAAQRALISAFGSLSEDVISNALVTSIFDASIEFERLEGSTNAATAAIARSANAYKTVFSTIADGSITLEQFNQLTAAGSTALVESTRRVSEAQGIIDNVSAEIAAIESRGDISGADEERLAILKSILTEYTGILVVNQSNLEILRSQRDILKEQEDSIRNRINTIDFLNSRIGSQINPLEQYFNTIKEQLGETAALAEEIDYFGELSVQASAGELSLRAFTTQLDSALEISTNLAESLGTGAEQALYGVTQETLADLQTSLMGIEGITVDLENNMIRIGGIDISVPTAQAAQEAQLFQKTQEAIFKLVSDTVIELQKINTASEARQDALNKELELEEKIANLNSITLELTEKQNTIANETAQSEFEITKLGRVIDLFNDRKDIEAETLSISERRAELAVTIAERELEASQSLANFRLEAITREAEAQSQKDAQNLQRLEQYASRVAELADVSNLSTLIDARDLAVNIQIEGLDSYINSLNADIQSINDAIGNNLNAILAVYDAQVAAAEQDFIRRRDLLILEQNNYDDGYNSTLDILDQQKVIADNNLAAAKTELSNLREIEQTKLDLLSAERTLAEKQITDEINLNTLRNQQIDAQRDLDISRLEADRELQVQKEQADIQNIIDRYRVLETEKLVNDTFFENWNRLLSARGEATADLLPTNPEAINSLIADLEAQSVSIGATINEIYAERISLVRRTAEVESANLTEQADLLNSRLASEQEYSQNIIAIRQQQLANEIAAAELEVDIRTAAFAEAAAEIAQLEAERVAAAQQFSAELIAIEEERAVAVIAAAEQAANAVIAEYNKIRSEINTFINNTLSQIENLQKTLVNLQNERIVIDIELEIQQIDLESQIREQLAGARIENLQAQVQLIESQEEGKLLSAVEAAERVNNLQLEILSLEEDLLFQRIIAENTSLALEAELLAEKAAQEEAAIRAQAELQRAQAQSQLEYLTGLANTFSSAITSQQQSFQSFNDAIAKTFSNAADAVNKAIVAALGEYAGTRIGAAVAAGIVASVDTSGLTAGVEAAVASFNALGNTIADVADQQISNLQTQTDAELNAINARIAANQEEYNIALDTAAIRRQTLEQERQNAIADAAGGGGGGGGAETAAEELEEALKDLQQKFRDAVENLKDSLVNAITKTIEIIGGAITANLETRIEQFAAQEELISGILEGTSNRLSEVQSSLNETLAEEISLRSEIKSQTEELLKAQESLTSSFKLQNSSITEASALYIEKLLEQKSSIIDLGSASDKILSLQREEKTLTEQQISQQEILDSIIRSRIATETKLEKTQQLLGLASDLLSGKFSELRNMFVSLAQTIDAVMQMIGIAGGTPGNSLIGINAISAAVSDFKKGVGEFVAAGGQLSSLGENASVQANAVGNIAETLNISSGALTTIASTLGGALQGFSIGGVISGIVGDTGWATSIGGALGGAVASYLVTSGVITNAILSFAAPIVGPVIGALLGSLFKKVPEASAAGVISAERSELTSSKERGGVKSGTAQALFDIANNSISEIISNLASAGVQFTEQVRVAIAFSGKSIKSASLQFGNDIQKFTASALGSGQAGAEAAAEFFTESFVKALQVGDLVTSNENLQLALDRFTSISDLAAKTPENLQKTIEFVSSFDTTLEELQSVAPTTASVLNKISIAAGASASALSSFYTRFLTDTRETFGEVSTQYAEATQSVRANSLAQIGLAEVTENGVTSLVSLQETLDKVDIGAVLVANTLDNILSSGQALAAAGIGDVITTRNIAARVAINTLLTDISTELNDGIALLKNPAMSAVTELKFILNNAADALRTQQGVYDALTARQADSQPITRTQLAQAARNIELQRELIDLNLSTYLAGLNQAQLEAVISSNALTGAQLELAQAQLDAFKIISNQRALRILIGTSKAFLDTLFKVGASFKSINILGVGPTFTEIAELIGSTTITGFVTSFGTLLNEIAAGNNVASNYSNTLELIRKEYLVNNKLTETGATLLEQLNTTTSEYIDTLDSLVSRLENVTSQIERTLTGATNAVKTAIEELRDTIINSVEGLVDSTKTILGIYDDTLATVAESGNKLFDLRDKATKALEDSAKAVKDFEKQNNLTGKTSAEVAAELADVQARLNTLLSDTDIDLAEFMQIQALTSQQRVLNNELSTLLQVESEYSALLEARDQAVTDLAFVESTILSLGDQLIDTRRTESELIQQVQDATVKFVNAQQDLLEITQLLDEANFDLLQVRIDEENAVNKVRAALQVYNASLNTLEENISGIISGNLLSDTITAAIDNYTLSLEAAGITGEEAAIKIAEFSQAAIAVGDNIQLIAEQLNEYLNPQALDIIDEPIITYDTLIESGLTNRFSQFSSDIVKYLDTEGMSVFYGAGGKFEKFRNALLTTVGVDGFEVLTAPGGPIEKFNQYFAGVSTVISNLIAKNANLNISISGIDTGFGVLVVGLGTTENKALEASSALIIVGEDLQTAALGTQVFSTSLGTFTATITSEDGIRSIDILREGYPEAIKSFTEAILTFGSDIGSLNISNSIENISSDITTYIGIFNSNISSLSVTTNAISISSSVKNIVDIFNSTIGSLNITSNAIEVTGELYTVLNIANNQATNIGNIAVNANVTTVSGNIYNVLNIANNQATNIGNIAVNANVTTVSGNIYNALNIANNSATQIGNIAVNANVTTVSGNIYNALNIANNRASQIGNIAVNANVTIVSGNIYNALNIANNRASQIGNITVNANVATISGNIYNALNIANNRASQIGTIAINANVTTISGNIYNALNTANNQATKIGNISINSNVATISGNIYNALNIANNQATKIGNISVNANVATISGNIYTVLNIANNSATQIGNISINSNVATISGNIYNALNIANNQATKIGNIAVNANVATISGNIYNALNIANNRASQIGNIAVNANVGAVSGNIYNALNIANNQASLIGNISVNANVGTVSGNIYNALNAANNQASLIGNIVVNTDVATVSGNIYNALNVANNQATKIGNISLNTNVAIISGDIYNALNIANNRAGQISNIAVNTDVATVSGNIYNALNVANNQATKIGNISLNTNVGTVSGNIYNALNIANNQATKIATIAVNANVTTVSGNIYNALNIANNQATKIATIAVNANVATISGNIYNALNIANNSASQIGTIAVNANVGTVSGNIYNALNIANNQATKIGNIAVNANVATISGNIYNAFNAANNRANQIGNISVNANVGTVSGNIYNALNIANNRASQIGNIAVNANVPTISGNIYNALNIANNQASLIGNISVNANVGTVSGNIYNALNAANNRASQIGNIAVNANVGAVSGNIYNALNAANNRVSQISNIAVTDNVGTVSGNIYSALNIANKQATRIGNISIASSASTASETIFTTLTFASIQADNIGKLNISSNVVAVTTSIFNALNAANIQTNNISALLTPNNVATVSTNIFRALRDANIQADNISRLIIANPELAAQTIKNRIDGVNNSFNTIIRSITDIADPSRLAKNISTKFMDPTNGFNAIIRSISIDNLPNVTTIRDVFNRLLGLFTTTASSNIDTLRNSVQQLITATTAIRATPGLASSLTTPAQDIAALTLEWNSLSNTLVGLVGSDGSLQGIKNAIRGIAESLSDAWEEVVGGLSTSAGTLSFEVNIPNITVDNSNAIPKNSRDNLNRIATNTSKALKIVGASYSEVSLGNPGVGLATGGYVSGPGTTVSDSIPARLSNGEFVLRAEAVRRIGVDTLNALNQTGNLAKALATKGRYGDGLVAHINADEAKLLKKAGGAGTINPYTGMLEFYRDAGAIGKVFAKEEIKYLRSLASNINTGNIENNYERFSNKSYAPALITADSTGFSINKDPNSNLFSANNYSKLGKSMEQTFDVINSAISARTGKPLKSLISNYATASHLAGEEYKNRIGVSGYKSIRYPEVGTWPGKVWGGSRGDTVDWYNNSRSDKLLGGWAARPSQLMSMISGLNSTTSDFYTKAPDASVIKSFVNAMNENINGNFTDFYMLTNGGLVGDNLSVSNSRDRAPALLEPGEFVLRKQAVDKLGIDNAIRLNSTGEVDAQPNIEVNIINNGTSQTTVSEPVIRKENGKLIVDVVLEDLKNNGPIKRQIKSIR